MIDYSLPKFMAVSKALADENRVRILALLQDRTLCVCQIIAVLGLAPSTVSKHLSILRSGGLLEIEKRGRWIHCRLAGEGAPAVAKQALSWLQGALKQAKHIENDRRSLAKVLKIDPERLCRRITGCC
jgi:DNA-binding transcriptional ArsR family regulator